MVQSILFLGSQMETAGAQEMLLTQAQWFHDQGNNVVAAFFYDKEGCYSNWSDRYSFPIVNLNGWQPGFKPANLLRLFGGLFGLSRLMVEYRFNSIETFTHHANFLGLPLAWLLGIPKRIASHHGNQEGFPGWLRPFYKWVVNSSMTSLLVVVSEEVKEYAIQNEGILSHKIHLIPNGINFSKFREISNQERQEILDGLDLYSEQFLILTVARLAAPKGHACLLQAAPAVLRQFPQTVFLLAGDGPLRRELELQAEKLGISQAVRFLGLRKDVPQLLSIADIFVLPSLTEGLPVAIMEAMAAGLPVVATRVGGVESLIHHEVNGLTVPPVDPVGLSRAIIRLLDDSQSARHFGEAAKQAVQSRFSADRMCLAYQQAFDYKL